FLSPTRGARRSRQRATRGVLPIPAHFANVGPSTQRPVVRPEPGDGALIVQRFRRQLNVLFAGSFALAVLPDPGLETLPRRGVAARDFQRPEVPVAPTSFFAQ